MSALQKQQVNEEFIVENDVSKEIKKEVVKTELDETVKNVVEEEEKEPKKPIDYSPQNISNELIQLEREIAEMHHVHVEPSSPALAQRVENADHNGGGDGENGTHGGKMLLEMQPRSRNSTPSGAHDAGQEGEVSNNCDIPGDLDHEALNANTDTALGHDDLIAVLKGIDSTEVQKPQQHETQSANQARAPSVTDSELAEGVTIEGEGQFQIMEVVDDEFEDIVDAVNNTAFSATPISSGKSFGGNTTQAKLTEDEIRAMAMEQIAGLKGQGRRRKQDIKPIQYTALESTDLISALGADWSDDDTAGEQADLRTNSSVSAINKLPSAVDISKEVSKPVSALPVVDRKNQISPLRSEVPVKQKSKLGVTHKSSNVLEGSSSGCATSGDNKEPEAVPLPPATGFKRTRIIKRKIIWDPDAPETQFSYAQLVRNTAKPKQEANLKPTATPSAPVAARTQSPIVVKKEPPVKKSRPSTPKDHVEKKSARAATPSKIVSAATTAKMVNTTAASNKNAAHSTKLSLPVTVVKDDVTKASAAPPPSQVKRRSQTPVANGAGGKKKKVSELDRLMGDEGAANMLNSLESELGKISTEQSDEDKPHKPLMRSRAATISERVTKREPANTTITPAVTKKEVPSSATAATSPKSKRAAKQKPSATWDYVYKQQASEDAMIIRRRSNSSYSSNASLHRSSLDGTGGGASGNSGGGGGSTKKTNPTTTADSNKTETPTSGTKSGSKSSSKSPNTRDNSLTDTSLQSPGSAGSSKQNTPNPTTGKAAFEFAKPESKSNQKTNRRTKSPAQSINPLAGDMKKATSVAGKRAARSPVTTSAVDEKEKSVKSAAAREETTTTPGTSSLSISAAVTSDVIVKKASKVAQIVFNTHKAKLNYTFTAQMMNKLVDILDKLSKDADCHVVVMTTNAAHFCHGVDFTDLTVGSIEKRKHFAVQLATAMKNYLKTLATFPKPLIAGVNGSNIGLGVTQLPLFDIVIASDKGSYETPYAKIGQVPEGYCIWNNITKIRGTFKTKLFWLCEKLHSTESALSGLVNKLTAPSKVNEDAFITAKKIAAMSVESYRHMKKSTIHNHLDTILTALDEEFDTIIDQWTSVECYENFKKYLVLGHF